MYKNIYKSKTRNANNYKKNILVSFSQQLYYTVCRLDITIINPYTILQHHTQGEYLELFYKWVAYIIHKNFIKEHHSEVPSPSFK